MILTVHNKKETLLKTSMQLFKEDGFRAVGVDKISEKSQIAKMTLYKYFPTKNDLITACLIEEDSMIRKSIYHVIRCYDYLDNLRHIYLWHVNQIFSEERYGHLFFKVIHEMHDDKLMTDFVYQHRKWKCELIRTQLLGLSIENPETFSVILLNIMENILFSSDKGIDHIAMWYLLESFLKSNIHSTVP